MHPSVDESWDVIVAWLARHSPYELDLIQPPAGEAAIRDVEHRMGTALPDDLVAWWRRADGRIGPGSLVPPCYYPYSVSRALDRRQVWMTAWNVVMEKVDPVRGAEIMAREDRAPAGTPCKDAWLPGWLPIAGDGGGDDLFVDLRPGPAHGCVREFVRVSGAGDTPLWDGVGTMLADVAAALTEDVPVHGYRVWVEDDGALSWDTGTSRWSIGGRVPVDVARLRERYAAFVAEVRTGGFGPPQAGAWPAEWIAAHVARNTELLIAATEAVLAEEQQQAVGGVRYDNSGAMDPVTLDRYAAGGLAALAGRVERLGARLCDLVEPLNRGRPIVHVRVVDAGATLIDAQQGWLGVLNALWGRQLPLRIRQLNALR